MRAITKNIDLPLGGEDRTFRLTKLDAFSGVRVLKMLSASDTDDLQELLFSLPAGFIRVWEAGCWGLPEMEHDTMLCFRLTQEVLAWTLSDFFPGGGQTS